MKQLLTSCILLTTFTATAQTHWQQRVDTKIDVQLDDIGHTLSAHEEFVYTNNSPDTLRSIFIHLWPNGYSNDHTPLEHQLDINGNSKFYYAKQSDRGYIDSLDFTVDGQTAEHYIADNAPDIARIDLQKPLLPGQHITVATPFKVKVPIVFSRMGHTGQAYYISQWFPKPAVYDQLGWHAFSYLDQGEFFSEYGSYDVRITLPQNYVVMATGNCTDERENAWLDSLSKLPIPADSASNSDYPASAATTKTLHYHEDNIHDFAWFADKRWLVRKDTVYSPGTDHLVTAWTAFLPTFSKQWEKGTEYLKDAVTHYGKWVGPYPYNTIKAVLGDMHAGGGMEYPTVTIIDKTASSSLKTVIIHEAGHNWFYGLLGSNERDHAWMDEGINTFYEQKTLAALADDKHRMINKKNPLNEELFYYELAVTDKDQAIDQTASNFAKLNYGMDVYYKTALMLNWLEAYMGPENFAKGMKDYYDTWHYKHPYPRDFNTCMQRHTDKPVDWFINGALQTDRKVDFAVTHAAEQDGKLIVTVHNKSDFAAPVRICAYNDDSLVGSVWSAPFAGDTTVTLAVKDWTKVRVDSVIPDAIMHNGVYKNGGLFHHPGIKVKPFLGLGRNESNSMYVSLSTGYNQYDSRMLGLMFHDLTVPEHRFRFAVAPMYAFGSKTLVGVASAGYIWYPRSVFKEIMLQADAKTFHEDEGTGLLPKTLYARYTKVAPSLTFTFNENDPLSPVTRTLELKGYSIAEQYVAGYELNPKLVSQQNNYGRVRYEHSNDRTFNPFGYSAETQAGADFAKINVEGNVRIDYNVKGKSLYVRGFVGKFIAINNDPTVASRYYLNSSYSGVDDYLYDGTYMGRNAQSRLAAQQVSIQEGGFKIPVFNNVDRSDNWMATINLKTDLPKQFKLLRLFFDAGLIPNANPSPTSTSSTTLLYSGGVELPLFKKVVSVYFPIVMSSDFQNYLQNSFGKKNVYARAISFTIDIQNINWLKSTGSLLKSAVN